MVMDRTKECVCVFAKAAENIRRLFCVTLLCMDTSSLLKALSFLILAAGFVFLIYRAIKRGVFMSLPFGSTLLMISKTQQPIMFWLFMAIFASLAAVLAYAAVLVLI